MYVHLRSELNIASQYKHNNHVPIPLLHGVAQKRSFSLKHKKNYNSNVYISDSNYKLNFSFNLNLVNLKCLKSVKSI